MNWTVRDYLLIFGLGWLIIWSLFVLFIYDFSRGAFVWMVPGVILTLAGLLNWRLGENLTEKQKTPIENADSYGPHEGW